MNSTYTYFDTSSNTLVDRLDFRFLLANLPIETDFQVVKIKDIITNYQLGKTVKNAPYQYEGEVPFIKIDNFINGELVLTPNTKYLKKNNFEELYGENISHKGDVLISIVASIGKIAKNNLCDCMTNQQIISFTLDESLVDKEYFVCVIKSMFIQDRLDGLKKISATPNMNTGDILNFKIPLMPLSEQQKTLPLVQSKIKVIENKIKELEKEKEKFELQNVVDEIFSKELDIEFPNEMLNRYNSFGEYSIISYNEFCDCGTMDMSSNYKFALVDELNEKYNCDLLKNMTSYLSGGRGYAKQVDDYTGYFRIMPKDMSAKDGYLNHKKLDNMTKDNYDEMVDTKIQADDIMMSVFGAGSIGRIVYNRGDIDAVPVNNIVATIRANEKINSKFLFYYLYSFIGQQQILRCITGTTGQISLSLPRVKKIFVPILDDKRQEEIVDKINNYGTPDAIIAKIKELQSIIDNDLNQYILNGYSDSLFTLPKEMKKSE